MSEGAMTKPFDSNEARALLQTGTGNPNADFRDNQLEAIESAFATGSRTLVLQRTGWGKSFVYFITVKMLRNRGEGIALLVSPLLSLMRNQLAAAAKMGLSAVVISSENPEDWDVIAEKIQTNKVDLLVISPERFSNEEFVNKVLSQISNRISMLVVDEAHCISDWGHDFRPDYRRIRSIINGLPQNFRLLATTATANLRVQTDLEEILGPNLRMIKGELARKSLTLQTIILPTQEERLAWLAKYLPQIPGSGIIYALTVHDSEVIANWLQKCEINAKAYHAQLSTDEKVSLENELISNKVKALVATSALGMGFDKPDLKFVIHYQVPGSVVAYYQQVGRAGRAVESAYGILLAGNEDLRIHSYFINSAFPKEDEIAAIIEALSIQEDGLSKRSLQQYVNLPEGRIDKTLKILSLEVPSPVLSVGTKWHATGVRTVSADFWEKVERLNAVRNQEVSDMQEYLRLPFGKHMSFLISELQGEAISSHTPLLPELPSQIDRETENKAKIFLKSEKHDFEPRSLWPSGAFQKYGFTGTIKKNDRIEPGLCLTLPGEKLWYEIGRMKYQDKAFSHEVAKQAAAQLYESVKENEITWLCAIPSARNPLLVSNLARLLACELKIEYRAALHTDKSHESQKSLNNSFFQAQNLDGAFRVDANSVNSGNVLLVDDFVDSRWTLTVAGALLRRAGSGLVFPYALAKSTSNG
jgi:ATP-dependent DNA helicase RecQ